MSCRQISPYLRNLPFALGPYSDHTELAREKLDSNLRNLCFDGGVFRQDSEDDDDRDDP